MSIQQMQVHSRFRFFEANNMSELIMKIRMFTAGGAIAAKSMSLEYVEARNLYVMCLGFAELQTGYPVKLTEVEIGPLPMDGELDPISMIMDQKAAEIGEVICHDIYVDKEGIVHAVFMQTVYIG